MNYCFTSIVRDNAPAGKKAVAQLLSPATGKIQRLHLAECELQRQRILGDGIAIILTQGEVFSPAPLIVTGLSPAKGSLTCTTVKGIKLHLQLGGANCMVHGERLQFNVCQGDKVDAKHPLFTCDPLWLKQQGITPYLYFTVLNAGLLSDIHCHTFSHTRVFDDPLFTLYKA